MEILFTFPAIFFSGKMAESAPTDHENPADPLEASLATLHSHLDDFSDSHKSSLSKPSIEKKIDEINEWIKKAKKSSGEKAKKHIQNVGKVVTATVNCVQKLQNGDVLNGALDVISSLAEIAGETMGGAVGAAVGVVIGILCSIIGAMFGANKAKQASIVEQLAEVVHKELVDFNKKL